MKISLVIAMLLSSTSAIRISHKNGCDNAACCMEMDPPMFFDGFACVATMPGGADGADGAPITTLYHEKAECADNTTWYEDVATAAECGVKMAKDGCEYFMFSESYPSWGCGCCPSS